MQENKSANNLGISKMAHLFLRWLRVFLIAAILIAAYQGFVKYSQENKILKEIVSRLEADSRAAQVLVTKVVFNEQTQKTYTTIKFLEFDSKGRALAPKYFTFAGNIIQFQSLIIRFDDMKVKYADRLRGKSAYIFLKTFMLDGANTQEFEIAHANDIPAGYKIEGVTSDFERKLWERFWRLALDPVSSSKAGIKNAQIEAPGTMFVPGTLYTIQIEHDGGLRIDASPLPKILEGETMP